MQPDPSATRQARYGQLAALAVFFLILLTPLPEARLRDALPPAARRTAAVAGAMGLLWLTQALPLAATSLLPLVAFPLLGVQSAKQVSGAYINENVFLYMGGFVIALGIERWGLHRRMALHVVRVVGVGPRRIVLGFALATAFLSMWISNTAAAMLMVPIAAALLTSLDELSAGESGEQAGGRKRATDRLGVAVMLAVAYSASIGGLTTLVGTPTNLAFRQIYAESFPDAPAISAGEWMTAFVPLGGAMLLAMWLVLTVGLPAIPGAKRLGRAFLTEQLRALGPPSPAERRMFVVFVATAMLWMTRTPLRLGGPETAALLPGWGPWVAAGIQRMGVEAGTAAGLIDDSTVAMAMAVLLFILPSGVRQPPETAQLDAARQADSSAAPPRQTRTNLMDWPTANRLPWEVLLLFGGGFALAGAFGASGLSKWVGGQFLVALAGQPAWLLVGATCLLLTFLTEFTSNTATCNIVLPILAAAAAPLGVDARLLMVPAAISASCAFMLPVATPPNAIVFGAGRVSVRQMAGYGIVLNLIGVGMVTLATLYLFAPRMGILTR